MAKLQEEGLIGAIGVTNFDTDASARWPCPTASRSPPTRSLLAGRPPRGGRAVRRSAARSGVKLLAYGTLCGGFLSEKWLGKPEPTRNPRLEPLEIQALHRRGRRLAGVPGHSRSGVRRSRSKHGVSISNVATRWVLEHDGGRGRDRRRAARRERASRRQSQGLLLRARRRGPRGSMPPSPPRSPSRAIAATNTAAALPSPRRAISAIISTRFPRSSRAMPVPGRPDRRGLVRAASGSRSPATAAPCASGDTHPGHRHHRHPWRRRLRRARRPAAQTTYILDKIAASISALGGSIEDVVAHPHLSQGRRQMGAGVARAWPRCSAR